MIALTLSGNSARACLPVARPLQALAAASVGCPSFAVEARVVRLRPPSVVEIARGPILSDAVCRTDTNTRKARTDRPTGKSRDTRDKKSGRNTVPRRGGASRPQSRRARRGGPWRRRRETCVRTTTTTTTTLHCCGEYLLELDTKCSPLFMGRL